VVVWPKLLLSEVLYDAPQPGTDTEYEWVELVNPGQQPVSLEGWSLRDNQGQDLIPAVVLEPGQYLVVAATRAGFLANHPGFAGLLVSLEGSIGNGLSNDGDLVALLAPDGSLVDAMSYGSNRSVFDPPCPDVPAGSSLARLPSLVDTDTAGDWVAQSVPNPGAAGVPPTATPTATPSPTATLTPSATPTPTATPTATPTLSPTITVTPTATAARYGYRHKATWCWGATPIPRPTVASR